MMNDSSGHWHAAHWHSSHSHWWWAHHSWVVHWWWHHSSWGCVVIWHWGWIGLLWLLSHWGKSLSWLEAANLLAVADAYAAANDDDQWNYNCGEDQRHADSSSSCESIIKVIPVNVEWIWNSFTHGGVTLAHDSIVEETMDCFVEHVDGHLRSVSQNILGHIDVGATVS